MEERAIHISSVNREKRGTSRPGDFTIKFNPPLKLDPNLLLTDYQWLTHGITLEVITKTRKSNTLMMVQHGKQLLSQMECIFTEILMIILIVHGSKKSSLNRLKWKTSLFNKFNFYSFHIPRFNFNWRRPSTWFEKNRIWRPHWIWKKEDLLQKQSMEQNYQILQIRLMY